MHNPVAPSRSRILPALIAIVLLSAILPHASAQAFRWGESKADPDTFGRAIARVEPSSRSCSDLSVTGDGSPGTILSFDLTGGIPESFAVLAVSVTEGTTTIDFGPVGKLELGLSSPMFPVPMGFTDQWGNAGTGFTIPAGSLRLPEFFVQAVSVNFRTPPLPASPQMWEFCTSEVEDIQLFGPSPEMPGNGNGNGKGNGNSGGGGGQDPGPGFGADGFVTLEIDVGDVRDYGSDVAIQADGKMLVSAAGGTDAVIARFDSAGVLDATYGTDGLFRFDLGGLEKLDRIEIQDDGKAVAVGMIGATSTEDYLLLRVNTDGTLDTTYGNGGHLVLAGRNEHHEHVSPTDEANVALDSNDNALVILRNGLDPQGDENIQVVRVTPAGILDSSFGDNGILEIDHNVNGNSGQSFARAIDVQSDDKVLLSYRSHNQIAITRVNTDGTLDSTFGTGGTVFLNPSPVWNEKPRSVRAYGDHILGVGEVKGDDGQFDIWVYRLDSSGNLDPSFGIGGYAIQDDGTVDLPMAAILDLDGNLRIAGYSSPSAGCPTAGKVWSVDANTGVFSPQTYVFNYGDQDACSTGPGKKGRAKGSDELLRGLALHADGSIAVTGYTNAFSANSDTSLGIIDSAP